MSRRRASYEPAAPTSADELDAMTYGRSTRERPMPGCTARCCWPGAEHERDVLVWLGLRLLRTGTLELALLLVALLVAVATLGGK